MENWLAGAMILNSFPSSEDFARGIMERYMDAEAYNNLYRNLIFRDTDKIVEQKVVEIRREQHVKIERKQETKEQKPYTYNKYAVLKEIINRYSTVLEDVINRHGDSAAWQIMSPMLKSILAFYRKSYAMEKVREADTQPVHNRYAVLKGIVSSYSAAFQEIINRHGDSAAWQIMSPMLKSILAFYRKSYGYRDRLEWHRLMAGRGGEEAAAEAGSTGVMLLQDRKELSARIHKISERTVSRITYETVRHLEEQAGKEKDKYETDTEEIERLKRKVDEHTKHIEKMKQMQKELMKSVTEEKEQRKQERLYQQVFEDSVKLEQMRYGLL